MVTKPDKSLPAHERLEQLFQQRGFSDYKWIEVCKDYDQTMNRYAFFMVH